MSSAVKKIIAFLATIIILIFMYLGAFLPLIKGKLYISIMLGMRSGEIRTFNDFANAVDAAMGFYSPIGQDEIVSYYTGSILINVITQQSNPEVIEFLLKDFEKWSEPIVKAGKGIGYSQNLYNFGQIYQAAGQKLKNNDYIQKSIDLFNEGLKNSPNRFMFLEGLFNDYQILGDKAKMKEVGNIILKYWPDKEEIKKILSGF